MGETIRTIMVASAAILWFFGGLPAQELSRLPAQGAAQPQRGFQIPDGLADAAGQVADQARQAIRGLAQQADSALEVPEFTGAMGRTRATARQNGPSTDPTPARENQWFPESVAAKNRPSTEPYSAALQSQFSRGGGAVAPGRNSPIATVSATEDPNSKEAQLMQRIKQQATEAKAAQAAAAQAAAAQAAAAQSSAAQTNPTAAQGAPTGGFGSLPKGVNLPARERPQSNNAASQSDLLLDKLNQTKAALAANDPTWDPSIYNDPAQSLAGEGQGSSLGMPSNSTFGLPGQNANAAQSGGIPTTWTAQHIAQLAARFNIPPTDPRLQNKVFVNELYHRLREYEQSQQSKNTTAVDSLALGSAQNWTGPLNNPPATTSMIGTGATGFGFPSGATQQRSNPSSPQANGAASPAWNQSATTPTQRRDVDSRLSQKDIDGLPPGAWSYDVKGNPIDRSGNILDRFGNRVDEATAKRLRFGSTGDQDQEGLLAKLRAEFHRQTQSQRTTPSALPEERLASRSPSDISNVNAESQRSILPGGRAYQEGSQNARATGNGAVRDRSLINQAGIVGASSSDKNAKSTFAINFLLLVSLVVNSFLIWHLRDIWYRYRNLIASSRMAASGISSSD